MKYLKQDEDGAWRFDDYFDHLAGIRAKIPSHLVGLINDRDRYWLDSPRSFHDAWLQTLKITGRHDVPKDYGYGIQISFLGPFHDRTFELAYLDVRAYRVDRGSERYRQHGPWANTDDLIVHEFDLADDGLLEHRMLFDSGTAIFIACGELTFREVMIEGQDHQGQG